MGAELVEQGRAALRAGDLPAARASFTTGLREQLDGTALVGLAEVAYLERGYAEAAARYAQAYRTFRLGGDLAAAGHAARAAAWVTGNVQGRWAVQNGWLARARRAFAAFPAGTPEHGWWLVAAAGSEPSPAERERLYLGAADIGRRCAEPDLEYEGLSWLGALYVLLDRVEEGLGLLDESLAAACAGEVGDLTSVDSMFCGFFWACEVVTDVPRATAWMSTAAPLMGRRHVVAAFCRAHYGGILTAAGRWSEAERELLVAAGHFEDGMAARREAAVLRLAELRLRQGRLDEGALLLEGLTSHPDAVRTSAALHLARGEAAVARDLLERATQGRDGEVPPVGESIRRAPLLSLLGEACLALGDVPAAEAVAARLERLAAGSRSPYLRATAGLARGRVCLARDRADARSCLQDAVSAYAEALLPYELSRTRLELARASLAQPEVAAAEAREAWAGFVRLRAVRAADEAAALLRSLGVRPPPLGTRGSVGGTALTTRESDVLALLGEGLSNAEIAARLFISRKTVEHHVGHVLAKLGLRNRAEAAAHVARSGVRR